MQALDTEAQALRRAIQRGGIADIGHDGGDASGSGYGRADASLEPIGLIRRLFCAARDALPGIPARISLTAQGVCGIVRRVGHVAPGPAAVPRGVIQGIPRRIRRTGGNSADVPQLGARVGQALSEL